MRYYSNTAQETTLAASASSGATSIVVSGTTGFPSSVPYILALDFEQANEELVLVTAISGTTLTVTRAYDGTAASTHDTGARVSHVHAAKDFLDSRLHEAATTGVHGITGAVVGTSDSQTLTNKNLSSGTNSFPATLATTAGLASHAALDTGVHGVTGNVVGTSDTQTLTGKTIDLTDNVLVGTLAEFSTAVSDADLVGVASIQALTNKTVDLDSNTVTGTLAEFNTAVQDADLASLAGSETLSNKTLASPVVTGVGEVRHAYKTANESVTSSTTLQDDDDLSLSVTTSAVYALEAVLVFDGATGGDIKYAVSVPASATCVGARNSIYAAAASEADDYTAILSETTGWPAGCLGVGSPSVAVLKGIVTTAGSSGNVKIQWAQNTSSGTATRMLAGAYLKLRRLA